MAYGQRLARDGRTQLLAGTARQSIRRRRNDTEALAIPMIKMVGRSNPQFAFGILVNRHDIAVRQTLRRTDPGKGGPVELVKPVLSANPHKARVVLQKAVHRQAAEAFILAVFVKGILLCARTQYHELAHPQYRADSLAEIHDQIIIRAQRAAVMAAFVAHFWLLIYQTLRYVKQAEETQRVSQ